MTVAIVVGPLAVATEGELKEEGRREGEGHCCTESVYIHETCHAKKDTIQSEHQL